ncbi:hypothetical protein [Brevibacterium linens]|uniref:hypothetical protein n=1 Tax=Brevibacterium linens TaxID=1703 RepID=UPI003BF5CF52
MYWMRNGFATTKNPRLGKSWTKTTRDHVWVDGKASTKRGYSTMERKTQGYLGDSLDQCKLYKYAQVIGYDEARTPGMGSAIFLNENTKSMKTANCISLYEVGLKKVMRWEGKTKIQSVNH